MVASVYMAKSGLAMSSHRTRSAGGSTCRSVTRFAVATLEGFLLSLWPSLSAASFLCGHLWSADRYAPVSLTSSSSGGDRLPLSSVARTITRSIARSTIRRDPVGDSTRLE